MRLGLAADHIHTAAAPSLLQWSGYTRFGQCKIQDPRQKITEFISDHILKVKKKKIFSNLYLNLRDELLYLVSDLKNIISYKKNPKICLNLLYP